MVDNLELYIDKQLLQMHCRLTPCALGVHMHRGCHMHDCQEANCSMPSLPVPVPPMTVLHSIASTHRAIYLQLRWLRLHAVLRLYCVKRVQRAVIVLSCSSVRLGLRATQDAAMAIVFTLYTNRTLLRESNAPFNRLHIQPEHNIIQV